MEHLKSVFWEPQDEFTPIPFWFWNDELNKNELIRQIHDLKSKEVMGFVLHPRMGLPRSQPYLSESFMELVEAAVLEAEAQGMTVILYDEGMYPSGAANGLVVKANPEYASRGLQMIEYPCSGLTNISFKLSPGDKVISVQAVRKRSEKEIDLEHCQIIDAYDSEGVIFEQPDDGEWSVLVFIDTFSKGTIRGIHEGQDDREADAPLAADLLNGDAVQTFITLTHEAYYRKLKRHFGKTVIAMFTDEPDLLGRNHIKGLKPWTTGFIDNYKAGGNEEKELGALWFEAGTRTTAIRRNYETSVHHRLAASYYRPLYEWCEEHGIALTGHPAASDDIGAQAWFHIPGQDVVWRYIAPEAGKAVDGVHSTMGKCASDAARHRGRRRVINECFGVCGKESGWSLRADEMKWYLDWLFVRGTNMISPHAFYYSIRDSRRDERPPDVGPNNIWWSEYEQFARYIKRMSWLMTDSVNQTELAVLAGPTSLPWKSVKPLFEQQIEFNYLETELLSSCTFTDNGRISIGKQQYKAVLIEDSGILGAKEAHLLSSFVERGGFVIEAAAKDEDEPMSIAGAKGNERKLYRLDETEKLPALLNGMITRDMVITPACSSVRISHVVKDGVHFYVLVNEGEEAFQGAVHTPLSGKAELWYPWSGAIRAAASFRNNAGEGIGIELTLQRRECLWLVIDTSLQGEERAGLEQEVVELLDLSVGWQAEGDFGSQQLTQLGSWTEWEGLGLQQMSGTVLYEKRFKLSEAAADDFESIELSLGDAHELVRVSLNGQEAGVRMWKPYVFKVNEALASGVGEHILQIEVTNSLANRYDGMSHLSGLLGPVKLSGLRSKMIGKDTVK
ncbi:glycosylhydrolase-like jelly roll fold domain-containing protein [Paenibacillus radicis (ex Xue et al. 2023)]|uniref:Glycosyl hydrolase n=1 Tax=Paenibacillus radicis (ex Xue et al. 2023) TaxID=2972489 RepID=A0ABT1YPM0_9BACL|nr:glycosylhydrolase-like jelly roll fold domain-containing protein [Paenibacillus radicis (ex Xue et al. 2023)]MCR8635119.1 glycosyl hydrolase [Paenibacillus radicis (ex Xue et al. 2023)]